MKLVMYSGGDNEDNEELDSELFNLIDRTNPVFTFIPSSFEEAEYYYDDFVHHYGDYGVRKFSLFPVDIPFDKEEVYRLFDSDLIYLSGGNTYYFLYHLRKSGLFPVLKEYLIQGGILAGQSAGSIIMTPNIGTAGFPDFDCDDNDVGLTNLTGMKLVNFEFFPHYSNTRRYIHELNLQSQTLAHPLYAVPDGSGIVVNDMKMTFVGDVWGFMRGKKYKF